MGFRWLGRAEEVAPRGWVAGRAPGWGGGRPERGGNVDAADRRGRSSSGGCLSRGFLPGLSCARGSGPRVGGGGGRGCCPRGARGPRRPRGGAAGGRVSGSACRRGGRGADGVRVGGRRGDGHPCGLRRGRSRRAGGSEGPGGYPLCDLLEGAEFRRGGGGAEEEQVPRGGRSRVVAVSGGRGSGVGRPRGDGLVAGLAGPGAGGP